MRCVLSWAGVLVEVSDVQATRRYSLVTVATNHRTGWKEGPIIHGANPIRRGHRFFYLPEQEQARAAVVRRVPRHKTFLLNSEHTSLLLAVDEQILPLGLGWRTYG